LAIRMQMRLKNWSLLSISALSAFCLFAPSIRAAEAKAVVTEGKINVRGQPSLVGEVITQLQKGDEVTVLEEINVENPKPGDPTNWAKIKLPANTPVWVFAPMVKNGAVAVSRLNLRAGPGENYSVLGRLDRGEPVKEIRTVEQWSEVQAPPSAYAFVDASLIKPTGENALPAAASAVAAPGTPAAGSKAESTADSTKEAVQNPQVVSQSVPVLPRPGNSVTNPPPVSSSKPVAQTTTPDTSNPTSANSELDSALAPATPVVPPPSTAIAPPAATPTNTTAIASANPVPARQSQPSVQTPSTPPTVLPPPGGAPARPLPQSLPKIAEAPAAKTELPAPRRIVRREGIIRPTRSIQAPTWYELVHPQTKETIDFLNEEKLGIKLKQYKGQKVVVTGEEGVDPRWPNTPIMEIETLDIAP
jgi:SH3-like domain-containing protein